MGNASDNLKDGEIVTAEIISLDTEERRIALSLKSVARRQEDIEALKFMERSEDSEGKLAGLSKQTGATLGDVFKEKLGTVIEEIANNKKEEPDEE